MKKIQLNLVKNLMVENIWPDVVLRGKSSKQVGDNIVGRPVEAAVPYKATALCLQTQNCGLIQGQVGQQCLRYGTNTFVRLMQSNPKLSLKFFS